MLPAARTRACLILTAALTLAPLTAAHADPLDPAIIQPAIQAWLTNLLGPSVTFPKPPITVTREGDHDRITIPADALATGIITANQPLATASLRPAGAAWSVDNITAPSPLRLTLHPPGSRTDLETLTVTLRDQATHARIDPTGLTESQLQSTIHGLDTVLDSRAGQQTQHTETATTDAHLKPAANHRADLIQTTDITGFASDHTTPDGKQLHLAADHLHATTRLDGLDSTKIGPLVQAALKISAGLAKAMPTPDNAQGTTEPDTAEPDTGATTGATTGTTAGRLAANMAKAIDHDAISQFLLALPGIAQGFDIQESADTVSFTIQGLPASLDHLGLGMAATAPDGILAAKLDLALDGLSAPVFAFILGDLSPQHIALRQTTSGLNLTAVMEMANQANGAPPAPTSTPLFAPSGLVTAVDRLSLDLGPATLAGTGTLTVGTDHALQGAGTITMTGFDALLTEVEQSPLLKSGMPILLMAKGLARTDGAALVWDIADDNGKLTVNGTEMRKPQPPAPRPRKRPQN